MTPYQGVHFDLLGGIPTGVMKKRGGLTMKLLVMIIAAALSIPALSDNHSPENPYLGFYYFSAPNAEAVVTAMDTF